VTGYIAGYPAGIGDGKRLLFNSGRVYGNAYVPTLLSVSFNAYGGESGAALYRLIDARPFVMGVWTQGLDNPTTGEVRPGGGTRIDQNKLFWLQYWIWSDRLGL
jgi:hypothetical protein